MDMAEYRAANYSARRISRAVRVRLTGSRWRARREIIRMAADLAAVLVTTTPRFTITEFYEACGFTDRDVVTALKYTGVL